ncbi:MAG: hypothetical protein K6C94_01655 [Candidatus Gastranaerophilales bacterium]|nr:hypothetical protein [Candidatus Gastranaerophilales bacterium]
MGLAASQARFLGLTARKSNTEYEGQQVNQQRTALANESASLYSQLTNLSVPTPPDITNYYTTEYSFTYGGTNYTMASLPKRSESGYHVSLSHIGTQYSYKNAPDVTIPASIDPSFSELNESGLSNYPRLGSSNFSILINQIMNDNSNNSNYTREAIEQAQFQAFTQNNLTYYLVKDTNNAKGYQIYQDTSTDVVLYDDYTDADIKYSNTGDIESINIPGLTGNEKVAVSTTSVADDAAYDEALNAYKKEYSEYEKTMAQINAKTEVLQQQDKSLELRLNQLDTEQNAISTEMDAVQKVIEKNVESTFKTFA